MQEYGIIQDGNLLLSSMQLDGYKPVEYEAVPDFDQITQYVIQAEPVDQGDIIFVGVEVHQLENTDNGNEGDGIGEIIP